jgi:hypothetical protein
MTHSVLKIVGLAGGDQLARFQTISWSKSARTSDIAVNTRGADLALGLAALLVDVLEHARARGLALGGIGLVAVGSLDDPGVRVWPRPWRARVSSSASMWQKSMRETPRADSRSRGSTWRRPGRRSGPDSRTSARRRAWRRLTDTGGQETHGLAFGPRRMATFTSLPFSPMGLARPRPRPARRQEGRVQARPGRAAARPTARCRRASRSRALTTSIDKGRAFWPDGSSRGAS